MDYLVCRSSETGVISVTLVEPEGATRAQFELSDAEAIALANALDDVVPLGPSHSEVRRAVEE